MATVRKVELLNKPYRFYGLTITQIGIMAVALGVAFWGGMNCPNVKVQLPGSELPLGFVVFMLIVCLFSFFAFATDLRPWPWWRNRFLYTFHLRPRMYLPQSLPGVVYPDATIIEESKDKSGQKYYRETGSDSKSKRKPEK
jgi:hypothetical protein